MRSSKIGWAGVGVVFLGCATGCSGGDDSAERSEPHASSPKASNPEASKANVPSPRAGDWEGVARVEVAARAIQPGVQTTINLHVLPNAICEVHEQGDDESAAELVTGDDGSALVHVYIDHDNTDTELFVDCESADSGKARFSTTVQARLGAHAIDELPTHDDAPLRPALKGDPMALSEEELNELDLPPRPDSARDPRGYATWLQVVSRPARRITAPPIESHRYHGPSQLAQSKGTAQRTLSGTAHTINSGNWCGIIAGDFLVYNQSFGSWSIPAVTGDGVTDSSSVWVGVGGEWDPSIVQAGNDMNSVHTSGGNVSTYKSWFEYFPDSTRYIAMTTVPGDSFLVYAMLSDSAGNRNSSGGYGWFYVINYSRALFYKGTLRAPAGHAVQADPNTSSSEIIVEKFIAGSHLANFGSFSTTPNLGGAMWDPDTVMTWSDPGLSHDNITMFSGSTVLCDSSTTSNAVSFNWRHF